MPGGKRISRKNIKELISNAEMVIMSDKDISDLGNELLYEYIGISKIFILTKGKYGSLLFENGKWW